MGIGSLKPQRFQEIDGAAIMKGTDRITEENLVNDIWRLQSCTQGAYARVTS